MDGIGGGLQIYVYIVLKGKFGKVSHTHRYWSIPHNCLLKPMWYYKVLEMSAHCNACEVKTCVMD